MMMPKTTVDLFRRGNASSPRFTYVRVGKDIPAVTRSGADWVLARSGGVSTFTRPGPGKNWWRLPAGSDYPDELHLVNDHGTHFNWEPNVDMPLHDFVAFLASVEPAFVKVN